MHRSRPRPIPTRPGASARLRAAFRPAGTGRYLLHEAGRDRPRGRRRRGLPPRRTADASDRAEAAVHGSRAGRPVPAARQPAPSLAPRSAPHLAFVLLAAFTIVNIRLAGFAVILAGLSMNFAVIAVNGEMPSRVRDVASGQGSTLAGLLERPGVKHHLARPEDQLRVPRGRIPVPPREPGDRASVTCSRSGCEHRDRVRDVPPRPLGPRRARSRGARCPGLRPAGGPTGRRTTCGRVAGRCSAPTSSS